MDHRKTNGKQKQAKNSAPIDGHPSDGLLVPEAELRLMALLLRAVACDDRNLAARILAKIEPDQLFDDECRAFYRCYYEASGRRQNPLVDPNSLLDAMGRCPGFRDRVAAFDWLMRLGRGDLSAPLVYCLDDSLNRVRAASQRRRSHDIVTGVAASLAQDDLSDSDVEKAREALSDALRGPDEDIPSAGEAIIDFCDWIESDEGTRLPTGLTMLDRCLAGGLAPGQLITVAGETGGGKSALALQIALNAANRGGSVLICSLEMSRNEMLQRLVCNLSGVSITKMQRGKSMDLLDRQAITESVNRLGNMPLRIDENPKRTVVEIESQADQVKRRHGLDLLVIDYLQLITPTGDPRKSRQEQVAEISRGMKLAARSLGCPVICLSQLRRLEGRKPRLSDLRESGAIEQDSDVVAFVTGCNTGATGRIGAQVHVAKQRNGPQSEIDVEWHGPTMSFKDIAGEEPF